ncbi:MAG: glycosyltransferase [Clostridia bacterium]|nr:glycosyltransferase [Clostridia bacterium]
MSEIKYALITTVDQSIKSFMLPYAEKLSDKGYKVYLICNFTDENYEKYSKSYECINIDMKRGFDFFSTIKTIYTLKKFFLKEKITVAEYGTENAAFCASIAAKISKVPVRIYDHWGARYVGFEGFFRKLSKLIEKIASKFSTDIRQVSEKNMKMCIDDGLYKPDKVKVLGKGGTVGVDFSVFDYSQKSTFNKSVRDQLNISYDSFIYGFVGRIQSDKGLNELLAAFKTIVNDNENVFLVIVGAEDNVNPLNPELIEWAKNSTRVFFTGPVNDVYRYISCFDVLVHPTYREGFGMVLQEAGALKVPIITTDIIGPGEFIIDKETGELVPPKDVNQLYSVMKKYLLDRELISNYAERNYNYTKSFFERQVMVNRIVDDRVSVINNRIHNSL